MSDIILMPAQNLGYMTKRRNYAMSLDEAFAVAHHRQRQKDCRVKQPGDGRCTHSVASPEGMGPNNPVPSELPIGTRDPRLAPSPGCRSG